MRISFDLDDTLILKTVDGPAEPALPALKRISLEERLRRGAKDLMCTLAGRGCEIWIYTNSYRGKNELLHWFSECGIPVANIVNQQLHDARRLELGLASLRPTKYPPWFGIDVHIDDSLELEEEARLHGFNVVRVAPDDPAWASTVTGAIERILKTGPEA